MTSIFVDNVLRNKLHDLAEPLTLCDEAGRPVGHFLPEPVYSELVQAALTVPFSPDEIERRRKETGGRTLPEIWNRLGRT
jgi:predicted nucleic acid-binding protein